MPRPQVWTRQQQVEAESLFALVVGFGSWLSGLPGELDVFFDTWQGLLRVVVVGACAYLSLVLLLRISGKHTLSKLNAFDLIVTVG